MQSERIFVVVKRSKWERDRVRYGSSRTARQIYSRQNNAFDRIHSAHERQMRNLDALRAALPDARYIQREELPYLQPGGCDLLISFGGDNHFVYVSHFAGGRPILGINSDPESSTGALLYFNPGSFLKQIPRLLGGTSGQPPLELEEWTRIGCNLELPEGRSKKTSPCISEITVRSSFHDYVSRYLIRINEAPGDWEEHKNSGLLLACGAGSTGWYRNCQPLSQQSKAAFPKDAPYFRIVAREVGSRARRRFDYIHATVEAGQTLSVVSEMDGEITVDADPERVFPFPPGAVAHFRLSDERLKVVRAVR